MRWRHSSVGDRGTVPRWRSSTAVTAGSRSSAIALPDRRLTCAARAGYQKQHSLHHRGVGNRFNAASDAHPVVSAVCRRCSIPTSTLPWSIGRLRRVPSARCGWTCRGPNTTRCRVRSPQTCWSSGRVIRGCGRHCMPHSAIRTSGSCSSTPNGWDGRRRVATAASSTPASPMAWRTESPAGPRKSRSSRRWGGTTLTACRPISSGWGLTSTGSAPGCCRSRRNRIRSPGCEEAARRRRGPVRSRSARFVTEVASPTYLAGLFSPDTLAIVHPAKLAFELARACAEAGVRDLRADERHVDGHLR